ncbi:MAG: GNAT family N-acetyltransferase [Chthonomonadales bacterium]
MAACTITPYRGGDLEAVVDLLNTALHADPVTRELFIQRVLLDRNFQPAAVPVARIERRIVGVLASVAPRYPVEDEELNRDRAYVTLVGVDARHRRQGVGTQLLEHAMAFLQRQGCRTVLVSPYPSNYWTPGIDEAAYPEAIAFFKARGFRTVSRPLSMDASLVGGWSVPEWVAHRCRELRAQGIRVEPLDFRLLPNLLAFVRREFPGDWQQLVRQAAAAIAAGHRPPSDLLIAHARSRILGFSHHTGERFGPFGVARTHRGQGIGAALLFLTLEAMRREGRHNAWFLWTDDATAARIYRAAGFRETRRYSVMRFG